MVEGIHGTNLVLCCGARKTDNIATENAWYCGDKDVQTLPTGQGWAASEVKDHIPNLPEISARSTSGLFHRSLLISPG